jgi:hypothetical protein
LQISRISSLSPLPFALVLLSIEWTRCLGEMIMVRRDSSSPQIQAYELQMSLKVIFYTLLDSTCLGFAIRCMHPDFLQIGHILKFSGSFCCHNYEFS